MNCRIFNIFLLKNFKGILWKKSLPNSSCVHWEKQWGPDGYVQSWLLVRIWDIPSFETGAFLFPYSLYYIGILGDNLKPFIV